MFIKIRLGPSIGSQNPSIFSWLSGAHGDLHPGMNWEILREIVSTTLIFLVGGKGYFVDHHSPFKIATLGYLNNYWYNIVGDLIGTMQQDLMYQLRSLLILKQKF